MHSTLITGGLGYIGSNIVADFLDNKKEIVIIDNLSNSSLNTLRLLQKLFNKKFYFYNDDITKKTDLNLIFKKHTIKNVIHLAALKSIPESISKPNKYIFNNVYGTMNLLECSKENKVNNFIFSSSASVYSKKNNFPVSEKSMIDYINVYSMTKIICEDFARYFCKKNNICLGILRYFNPLGNHKSGFFGETLTENSTNIMPMIIKSIINNEPFKIFGTNLNTKDGSPVRDYIHVSDLSYAHKLLLEFMIDTKKSYLFNVGTGLGTSVKELLNIFQKVNNIELKIINAKQRPGDLSVCYADSSRIQNTLKWKSKKTVEDMCYDSFNFYKPTSKNFLT